LTRHRRGTDNFALARGARIALALSPFFLCAPCSQAQTPKLRTVPIKAAAVSSSALEPRQFAAVAHDYTHHQFLLFGGTYGSLRFGDTSLLNTLPSLGPVGWIAETPTSSPAARISSAAAYFPGNREFVLFGGRVQQANPNSCSPGGVPEHLQSEYFCGDTWTFNFQTWIKISPSVSPSAREGHAMVYDAARNQIVLFGGTSGSNDTPLNDTWLWDGTTWKQAFPAHSPPARIWHSMAYDPLHSVVLLFGGDAGTQFLNDTWLWNGSDWQPAAAQSTPPPLRTSAALDYDPVTASMVLFSGTTWTAKRTGSPATDSWSWDGAQWHQLPAAKFQLLTDFTQLASTPLTNAILASGTPSLLWLPVQ
jgi:hypothetical protein